MQLSIRGHHQFDLPWQILRLRLSTGFLSKGVKLKVDPKWRRILLGGRILKLSDKLSMTKAFTARKKKSAVHGAFA